MWLRSGVLIDPLNLAKDIERVSIGDIAWALAHVNRWAGHASPGISVAQHALACAKAGLRQSPRLALLCLHHDDGEAFFGDMTRDLKSQPEMRWYREQEHAATEICVGHFAPQCAGMAISASKEIDIRSLLWERERLFPTSKEATSYHPELEPLLDADFYPWLSPEDTAKAWEHMHVSLQTLLQAAA